MKLNAKELRDVDPSDISLDMKKIKRNSLYLIVENVYDTYNIGGLFRLADALAVEKIYLCGEMEIPPDPRIAKSSVGTYKVVPWEYKETAQLAIEDLHKKNVKVYAVEQSDTSQLFTDINYSLPAALLVGNETYGVLPETLELADQIVEIPMWGVNKSLNVIVSAAIVSYFVLSK
jgi:tRNA G18 (ribose-2'-O)-methylase SpoU